MPSSDVLLLKYITDSCYASLEQVYADMFKEAPDSNRRTKTPLKNTVTNKAKSFSPDRGKKLKDPIVTAMTQFLQQCPNL